MVQFGPDQFIHHGADARLPAFGCICELPKGVVFHGLDPRCQVGQLLADERVLRLGLAIAAMAAGQAHEVLQHELRTGRRAQHVALMKKGSIGDKPALVEFPDHIRSRDAHILKKDLVKAGVSRHLNEGADRDPGCLHINQNI